MKLHHALNLIGMLGSIHLLASTLVAWIPTPAEIKSANYLIFYNTVRRIALNQPWDPSVRIKSATKMDDSGTE